MSVNSKYNTDGGKDTVDKIFLLSIDEAEKYFSSDAARECEPTEYAKAQDVWASDNGYCRWWLRAPGYDQFYAANVHVYGGVNSLGYYVVNVDNAIRPALWINIK